MEQMSLWPNSMSTKSPGWRLLYTLSHRPSLRKDRALRPALAAFTQVIFLGLKMVYAWEAQPHIPFSSLSAFFMVLSPVKKTTGLPGSLVKSSTGKATFFIIACKGARLGSLLSASPSAAERAFIIAPKREVWMWSVKKWYFSFQWP